MTDVILVLNAGSSSLKFSAFLAGDPPTCLIRGQLYGMLSRPQFVARDAAGNIVGNREWRVGTRISHEEAIDFLLGWGREGALGGRRVGAVGHRVVHGGLKYSQPVVVTGEVLAALRDFVPLAPLHQPHNLAAVEAVMRQAPELPQVACFDTAFHRAQPPVAQAFALPRRYSRDGIRRYGFHGISYEYIASILPAVDERAAAERTVVAHLGSGASMCAMRAGRSVAATMGFTAVDGLPMGTRCGSLDPGVLLHLTDHYGLGPRELEDLIYKQSGLLGVSEISNDLRTLLASPDPRAAEAVDLFVYRIGRELGSLAAALGGLDALVFTAGIGENSAPIRERVCRDTAWLGLDFDAGANEAGGPRISRPDSRVSAWVVPTNEELMIARHTLDALAARRA